MTILDAYGVLAYLKREPAGPLVRELLDRPPVAMTALGVAEVLDHLVRSAGADEREAALDLAQLGLHSALPVTSEVGAAAGRLRARHYHRRTRTVSLADCVAAAVASITNRPLATSDPHLLDLCHEEAVLVIVLPDAAGRTWTRPTA